MFTQFNNQNALVPRCLTSLDSLLQLPEVPYIDTAPPMIAKDVVDVGIVENCDDRNRCYTRFSDPFVAVVCMNNDDSLGVYRAPFAAAAG